jgi:hypothetical protein
VIGGLPWVGARKAKDSDNKILMALDINLSAAFMNHSSLRGSIHELRSLQRQGSGS